VAEHARDRWAEWLLERRFGGSAADAATRERFLEGLWSVRDTVLDHARLGPDDVLLDVGCGDGLIGFGALERGVGRVVFSDISRDLLDTCRELAVQIGVEGRSQFLEAAADDLSRLPSGSIDVVTTRSVLIYVKEKVRAFDEFFRVLRPGGRVSLYEPINTFALTENWRQRFWLYPADRLGDLAEKISAVFEARQQPGDDPMLDFDERDLIRFAEGAGFFPVELELRAEVRAADPRPWQVFLHSSGNPSIPTFAEAMDEALTSAERERVVSYLKPLVEEGRGVWRMAHAYLSATKPHPD
jgi:arsenite methyltransferase